MKRVYKTSAQIAKDLNKTIKPALSYFKPPEKLYVDQWADKYRILSPETSAEAGPWRTDRTPYLREPMRAFNDPIVHRITIAAGSQVGKTELELNIAGFTMDQIPSSMKILILFCKKHFREVCLQFVVQKLHLIYAQLRLKL